MADKRVNYKKSKIISEIENRDAGQFTKAINGEIETDIEHSMESTFTPNVKPAKVKEYSKDPEILEEIEKQLATLQKLLRTDMLSSTAEERHLNSVIVTHPIRVSIKGKEVTVYCDLEANFFYSREEAVDSSKKLLRLHHYVKKVKRTGKTTHVPLHTSLLILKALNTIEKPISAQLYALWESDPSRVGIYTDRGTLQFYDRLFRYIKSETYWQEFYFEECSNRAVDSIRRNCMLKQKLSFPLFLKLSRGIATMDIVAIRPCSKAMEKRLRNWLISKSITIVEYNNAIENYKVNKRLVYAIQEAEKEMYYESQIHLHLSTSEEVLYTTVMRAFDNDARVRKEALDEFKTQEAYAKHQIKVLREKRLDKKAVAKKFIANAKFLKLELIFADDLIKNQTIDDSFFLDIGEITIPEALNYIDFDNDYETTNEEEDEDEVLEGHYADEDEDETPIYSLEEDEDADEEEEVLPKRVTENSKAPTSVTQVITNVQVDSNDEVADYLIYLLETPSLVFKGTLKEAHAWGAKYIAEHNLTWEAERQGKKLIQIEVIKVASH